MKHYAYNSPFKMKDKDGVKYTLEVELSDWADDPREWDNLCTMICWSRNYDLGDKHTFETPSEFMQHLYLDVTGKHWCDEHESDDWQDVYKALKETNLVLIKAINIYDHSGITVSTSNSYPYNDYWDAGIVGFIYVTKKTIFDEGCCLCEKDENGDYILIEHKHENAQSTYSRKTIPTTEKNWKEVADYYLEGEMETYDQYVRGEVYSYRLTKTVIQQDKCPHCGEVIREYEEEEFVDGCSGFYGGCLEENGILDYLNDLEFVEED